MTRYDHLVEGQRALGRAARERTAGNHTEATIWAFKALTHFAAAGTIPVRQE